MVPLDFTFKKGGALKEWLGTIFKTLAVFSKNGPFSKIHYSQLNHK